MILGWFIVALFCDSNDDIQLNCFGETAKIDREISWENHEFKWYIVLEFDLELHYQRIFAINDKVFIKNY